MIASAQYNLPYERRNGRIGFRTTTEQDLLIRKAAELQGWTVTQYVLCAVLDRAERDLYTQAARVERTAHGDTGSMPEAAAEALDAVAGIYSS